MDELQYTIIIIFMCLKCSHNKTPMENCDLNNLCHVGGNYVSIDK